MLCQDASKAVFGSCKSISGKYPIFRKGKCFHVFGCILKKFSKNIFWCLEKKKEKTNPEKKIINDRRSTGFDGAVLRELQSDDRIVDRDPRSRSLRLRSMRRDRDLAKHGTIAIDAARSRSTAQCFTRSRSTAQSSDWSLRD